MARAYTTWSPELIADVLHLRARGLAYATIAEQLAESHNVNMTAEAVRHIVRKNKDQAEFDPADADVETLRAVRRTQRTNASVAKQNRAILDHLNEQQDIVAAINAAASTVARRPKVKVRKSKQSSKTKMTIEMLVSDVHFGKKTETFNHAVCRRRLQHYTAVTIGEIERANKNFDVEHLIVGLLGDIIESSTIHGPESQVGCEFNSSEQLQVAIESLMLDVLEPVAQLGIPITVIAVVGNHDRLEQNKTYNMPGRNGLTWVIYKTLEMMCNRAGYTHMKWVIPEGIYTTIDIYGTTVLVEHGDFIDGGLSAKAFNSHIVKRSLQLGKSIRCLRIGHWHTFSNFDNGAVIVNASVPGNDSYADVRGYNSSAGQAISLYVKTKNRQTSYYHTLLVQLGEIV